jgi:hypothetical protein
VVWVDYFPGNSEIYYKTSTSGGTTWTTKRLTWNSGSSFYPSVAAGPTNHIYVAWDNETPSSDEIFYKKSTDGGVTWTTKRLTWNPGDSNVSFIAVDSNDHIHLAWSDKTPGNDEIFYKKSTDGGVTWTTKRLTWNFGTSWNPCIAIDTNSHIHVAWRDSTPGKREIYYKKSTNGGTTWTTKRLTPNLYDSFWPSMAVDSYDHLHVVWEDPILGNDDIFYNRSTSGGTTWTTQLLTWNSGASELPAVAVDSSNHIHVVWKDATPGNDEIYYRKGIQTTPPTFGTVVFVNQTGQRLRGYIDGIFQSFIEIGQTRIYNNILPGLHVLKADNFGSGEWTEQINLSAGQTFIWPII